MPMVSSSGPRSRLSGSAWALFRPDSAGSTLGPGGTLGGAQAGVRAFYEPGPRGLALTVRLSAPLALRSGREASAGVGIRGRAVGILLERRIALDDGARNAMSVTAYGGFNDVVLPHGLRAEGYGQIGIVGARRRDAFADGAVRIVHPLSGAGTTRLAVGAALSGGAQPGVTRVDVGPELIGIVSADQRPVRITAGWRQRIAGNAAPGSGPALSVDIGF
ncbi:hypothetical protein [Sphingomonas sp.]|uniref:hypothetical protein n=1 Tax=Sphingomonas sp. TaxID=28214 RepID=UPI0025F7D5A7|nr:hypothetical protein [Sphingomonas sp.]